MQDKTIDNMTPETKEWFARAIVGMILADGKVDKAEIDYLNNLIGFLKEPSLVQTMSNMLQNSEMPSLEPLEVVTNESLEIIKHLTIMSVVDENLANREVRFLKYAADQLGLPEEIPDRFLSLAKEKLRRAKYTARITTNDFSEQVRCFDLTEAGCMFYSFHKIQSNTPISLQFYMENQNPNETSLYQTAVAEVSWSRPVQSKHGNFVVGISFNHPLEAIQGLELIRYIQSEEDNL